MATKINTSYYGVEANWTQVNSLNWNNEAKCSEFTFKQLVTNGSWDIDNNVNIDSSAIPWGIPECSLTSGAYTMFLSVGQSSSSNGTADFQIFESNNKNSPVMFVGSASASSYCFVRSYVSGDSASQMRAKQNARIMGKTAASGTNIISTASADNGTTLSRNEYGLKPITLLNYQKAKIILDTCCFINKKQKGANFAPISLTFPQVATHIEDEPDNWFLCGVTATMTVNNKTATSGQLSAVLPYPIKSPDNLTKCYFGSTTNMVKLNQGLLGIGTGYLSSYLNTSTIKKEDIDAAAISTSFPAGNYATQKLNASAKRQIFDDVSYHWEIGLRHGSSTYVQWCYNGVDIPDGTEQLCTYMVIDDMGDYSTKFEAYAAAILHEFAFLGLPIAQSTSDIELNIGDNGILLPVFDVEHMVTTGNYINGSDSLELPNALWNDIFDDGIPDWDSNYIPPDPVEPDEENDYGDIENLGSARGLFPAGVNIYLMSRLDYNTFMSELNSYYANSTPDDWTLDFQGVNPSDYILNVYYTPYNFVKSDTKSNVKIGQITLTSEAYELSQGSPGVDDPNKWKYFTYGTRTVTSLFNDFRDYDPYTKVELYLPLAGTIELDTNYVMNHDITVEYYFDLMTMSGVAAVYRDSMLYKTSDFKLGAQVPLLITNMGQIQNQITQLEFSQKQNNLRLATSAISSGVSIGSILAGGGEASTTQTIGAAGGTFALASAVMKADEIDYQLKHTSPSVSVTGAAEPLNNYSVGQLTPKLIIKRPLMLNTLDNAIYSKTIGNSCCINTTLNSINGLVVCSSIDTTGIQKEISTGVYISPTIDEVNMIKSTFNSGVIL